MQALSVKAIGGLLYLFLAFSALIFLPSWTSALGDILVTLGLLVTFLFKANSFSAQTAETEAGQEVISKGPYALVRHPMYAGGLVMMAGLALFAPVIAWRVLDEEKVLAKDLPGYAEYRSKVKFRLIPCVW